MENLTVNLGDENAFFARGRTIAALADAGHPIPSDWTIRFGDPVDLLKVLTPARLQLIGALKAGPSSITALSNHLRRDRSSVRKDVEHLQLRGVLQVEHKVLPGRGKQKEVSLTAERIQLQALLT